MRNIFAGVTSSKEKPAYFKSWMSDLATVVEYVDHGLARDAKMQIKERPKIEVHEW